MSGVIPFAELCPTLENTLDIAMSFLDFSFQKMLKNHALVAAVLNGHKW